MLRFKSHFNTNFWLTDSINPDNLPGDELPDWVQEERVQFKEHLDSDHDGLLGYDEIKEWMAPDQKKFFEEEAKHLLNNVDQDQVSWSKTLNFTTQIIIILLYVTAIFASRMVIWV